MRAWRALGAVAVVVVVALLWLAGIVFLAPEEPSAHSGGVPHPAEESLAGKTPAARPEVDSQGGGEAGGDLRRLLEEAWTGLAQTGGANPAEARRILERLKRRLDQAPIGEAAAAIVEFLRSGRDAATGLEFEVGEGGVLEGAPSLRVALLDALGGVDPLAAAEFSRELLPQVSSGAESAVALRNLDWGARVEDAVVFREATLRHLSNAEWAASPEAGYLEGYDAAVRLGDPVVVGILARRTQEDSGEAVANAAWLALERLAGSGSAPVLESIAAEERLAPARAGELLALADVGDSGQRAVVEALLLDDGRAGTRAVFFKAFPLASHSVGPRLITEETLPGADERLAADAVALEVVEEWLGDARFEALRGELGRVAERLREF
jgi:hypothetical protein